jgi:hypothetical protein
MTITANIREQVRQRERQRAEQMYLLSRYNNLVELIEKMHIEQSVLLDEQQKLLKKQKKWLALFLNKEDWY